ncbi:hypothetical protein EPN15_05500 [Patescibacteria group bacterium]|nr:MAG: hypothetical protein EPN15_05500 [Patescibacteria group bacterium]
MENFEKHFLEQYKVQDKSEAKDAAKRKEIRTGEEGIFEDRSRRIEAYIERLEEIFTHPDAKTRERRTDIFKEKFLYPAVIVKEENFPESYFEYQKQLAKERGIGDIEFSPEDKQKAVADVQEAQRKSLDAWIDHLADDDCHYPADIKYFVAQGILKTGKFDEKAYRFSDREKSTTASFRQIDHEALAMVMGALEAVHHHKRRESSYHSELLDLMKRNKDFGSMYAEAMRYLDKEASKDKALEITDGEWRVFSQGSDPRELVNAFAGKRAFLCLGNIGDASGYLKQGDVQVYFSNNRAGEPVWPRAAIAIKPETGAYELRGTYNSNEDIDPEIAKTDIIKERLATIKNGESFAKKDADMKKVTELYELCFKIDKKTEEKTYLNPELTKDDLIFLYEIDAPIEGFGYEKDPRVAELRAQRNPEEDMLTIFECSREQIARTSDDINENTKAYVGQLEPGIFQKLPENIEHIYALFPGTEIRREYVEIGKKTSEQLLSELKQAGIKLSNYSKATLKSRDFIACKNTGVLTLIRLTLADLGFTTRKVTINQIYQHAKEYGLELCPVEVAQAYRLKYTNQPIGELMYVGTRKTISSEGYQGAFELGRDDDGLWLSDRWAGPVGLDSDAKFVFCLRKPKNS